MQKIKILGLSPSWSRYVSRYKNSLHWKNKYFSSHTNLNMENPLFTEGNIQIYGNYEKEYEPVKDAFVQNFISGQEINASICVYVKQKCVIDMYGTSTKDTTYNSNCLQVSALCYFQNLEFQ